MAGQLIEAMSGPWRPSDYRDAYTDRVNELIDAKTHDRVVQPSGEAPEATDVAGLTDALRAGLTDALRASLDAARKPRHGGRPATKKKAGTTSGSRGRAKSPRNKKGAA